MSRQDFMKFPWCVCCLLSEESKCIDKCQTRASRNLKRHTCSSQWVTSFNAQFLKPASKPARCGTIAPMWATLPYGHELAPREKWMH